jgi:hypothetical protein
MADVSKSVTAVNDVSAVLAIRQGETVTYDVSGSFTATVVVEQARSRDVWTVIATATAAASGAFTAERAGTRYRFRCTAFTSGTATCTLTRSGLDTSQASIRAAEATFTENGAGTYTATVPIPGGATILDIIVNGIALWAAATSAVLKVGDAADDDGYYTAVNLKATDLLAGESIAFDQAGGKAGAYIANSQVSPRYSATPRVISGVVTSVGAGTTGRTRMMVVYHVPLTVEAIAAVQA